MNIDSNLKDMDLNQLLHVAERVRHFVAAKKSEKQVIIWRVCERSLCYGNFAEADYLKAVALLAVTAEGLLAQGADPEELELGISGQRMPESEAAEYLDKQ